MQKCIEQQFSNGDKIIVNPKTGEVMDFHEKTIYIQTEEERKQAAEYFKKVKENEERLKIINEKFKEYGGFVWNVYNINEKTFPQLKPSSITRLMFLSTYLNYDGYLMYNKRTIMNKKQLFETMKLSEREFHYFYKELIDYKILKTVDDKLYINQDLFGKGQLHKKIIAEFSFKEKYITRLYIDGIRELYDKSTPRSHKTLSYLFQILPYVNRQYNIVCFNPLENDLNLVQGMSLGQFCETIGYSEHNSNKLFRTLFEPQFIINGKVTTAMRYVVDKGLEKSTYSMFINPKVYYAGNRWKDVEVLGKF